MAIKIPSKNIYEMNNPKVRDNLIDNLSVDRTVIEPNNEFDVSVATQEVSLENYIQNELVRNANCKIQSTGNASEYKYVMASCGISTAYIQKTIKIPKHQNNKYITKIREENPIQIDLQCKKYIGNTIVDISWEANADETTKNILVNNVDLSYDNQSLERIRVVGAFSSTNNISVEYDSSTANGKIYENIGDFGDNNENSPQNLYVTAQARIEDTSSPPIVSVIENDIDITINIICGIEKFIASGQGTATIYDTMKFYSTLVGECRKYIPEQLSITINGSSIGINLKDNSITYIKDQNGNIVQGSGSKPQSLSGNELLQDSGKTNGTAISEHLANNVLTQYSKGKETATLLCDINDYYDESGKEVISTKAPLLPNEYQQVEYIESYDSYDNTYGNGVVKGAYIDTGYIPNKNTGFDIVFESNNTLSSTTPTTTSKNGYGCILGARKASWNNDFQLSTYNSSTDSIGGIFRDGISPYINANIQVGIKQHCTLNGTTYTNNNGYSTSGVMVDNFNPECNLYLFALNDLDLGGAVQRARMRLYSCIITENGKKVRNFIPCYKISDNEIGLYDTVQGKFYSNSGDIGFKKGKNIKSTPMVFNNHDKVIPYVFGANGEDKPMSKYQDGNPKVFEVVGTNIIYDGAVWQELSLQEIDNPNS